MGIVRPGILADHVVAPHVAEYDGPELMLESAAVSQDIRYFTSESVQQSSRIMWFSIRAYLDRLRDLLQPGAVMAFSVEVEVVFPQLPG